MNERRIQQSLMAEVLNNKNHVGGVMAKKYTYRSFYCYDGRYLNDGEMDGMIRHGGRLAFAIPCHDSDSYNNEQRTGIRLIFEYEVEDE